MAEGSAHGRCWPTGAPTLRPVSWVDLMSATAVGPSQIASATVSTDGHELDLMLRRIGAVLRRRWMVLCAAMLAAIVLGAAAYLAAEPRYLATAQVALERTATSVASLPDAAESFR